VPGEINPESDGQVQAASEVVMKVSRLFFGFLCILILMISPPANAAETDEKLVEFTIFGGGFFSDNDFMKDNPGGGVRATYMFTQRFGIEGSLSTQPISSRSFADGDTYITLDSYTLMYHGNGVMHLAKGKVIPFIAGGIGATTFAFSHTLSQPEGWIGSSDYKTYFSIDYGGGMKILLKHNLGLRFDVRGYRIFTETPTDLFR
jgi:hypothetical protein